MMVQVLGGPYGGEIHDVPGRPSKILFIEPVEDLRPGYMTGRPQGDIEVRTIEVPIEHLSFYRFPIADWSKRRYR